VPFIEDHKEACDLYLADEGQFWLQVFDPDHPYHLLPMLVCDGAHRLEVCTVKGIAKMRANFLRPSISLTELVLVAAHKLLLIYSCLICFTTVNPLIFVLWFM
jgi:hypothetical protein